MAKTIRSSKKKSTKRRSFAKKSGQLSAQGYVSTIPRQWFPQLPAEMRFAMKASSIANQTIPGNGNLVASSSLVLPNAFGAYPEGFPQLMSLYTRAWVERVSIDWITQAASNTTVAWAACVATAQDGAQLNAVAGPQMVRQFPDSKYGQLGAIGGGHDQARVKFFNDNRKSVGPGISDQSYCTTSTNANPVVLTPPVILNLPDSPFFYMIYQNTTITPMDLVLTREFTFHMVFTGRHAAYLQ